MHDVTLRTAVISGDLTFRTVVAGVLQLHPEVAAIIADLAVPAGALNAESIDRVQAEAPEVVLVDLDGDPAGGIRMVRLLGDAAPSCTLIATGPPLAPELLLEGMKAGIKEYLPAPVDPHDLADALRRAARRLGRGSSYRTVAGRVITFVGAKGGTGVTTTVANAALELHQAVAGRTLLLDLNLEGGNLAIALGLKPRFSIADLLDNFHRVDESLLSSLVVHHESGVDLLSAPLLPESAPILAADQAHATLRLLRRHYDLIVVDLARPYTEYGRATIDDSDVVFLMVVPDVLAVHGAKRLLPLVRKGIEGRDGKLAIVLNRLGPADEIQKRDVEEALDVQVSHVIRRDDATVMSSLNMGKPVTMNGGRSRYVRDLHDLCRAVTGTTRVEARGLGGLLRGLRRGGK